MNDFKDIKKKKTTLSGNCLHAGTFVIQIFLVGHGEDMVNQCVTFEIDWEASCQTTSLQNSSQWVDPQMSQCQWMRTKTRKRKAELKWWFFHKHLRLSMYSPNTTTSISFYVVHNSCHGFAPQTDTIRVKFNKKICIDIKILIQGRRGGSVG